MAYPTVAVQVSFGTTRFATPSYTTLASADVQAVQIVRGNQSELDAPSPGTLSVGLDSTARKYDSNYAAGPYYPNLTPGRKVRVTATYAAVTYELFNGWADAWPQTYQLRTGTTTLKASGAFKFLERMVAGDPYAAEVLADTPTAWYRLGEAQGTVIADSSGNGHDGVWMPELATVKHGPGLIVSNDNAIELPGSPSYAVGKVPAAAVPSLRPCTVECWVQIDKVPLLLGTEFYAGLLWTSTINSAPGIGIRINSTSIPWWGAVTFAVWDGTTIVSTTTEGLDWWITDGRVHHLVCTYNSAGTVLNIFDNGHTVFPTSTIPAALSTGVGASGVIDINYVGSWDGKAVLDELAFYNVELTPTRIAAHFAAGSTPWGGDTTGGRFTHLLDLIGWPAGLRDIDTGQSILGVANGVAGAKALAYLGQVTSSEQGRMEEAHADAGKVRFRDRSAVLTEARSTTVQTLISDNVLDIAFNSAVPYVAIGLATDDRPAANVVTVKWVGGSVISRSQSSVDQYGEIPATVDTLLESATEAANLADFVLTEQSALFTRIRSVTIEPSSLKAPYDALAWVACLSRQEGDRVRVVYQPTSVGTQIDQQLWIIGIDHDMGVGGQGWRTTFHFTTASSTAYWVLGTGALGSTDVLAY